MTSTKTPPHSCTCTTSQAARFCCSHASAAWLSASYGNVSTTWTPAWLGFQGIKRKKENLIASHKEKASHSIGVCT